MSIKPVLMVALLLLGLAMHAQNPGFPYTADNSAATHTDSTLKSFNKLLNVLREFRLQAAIQPEWQYADTTGAAAVGPIGVGTFSGGLFPVAANNRFQLRRGRLRLSFEHSNAKDLRIMDFAFQFDATERGFSVKEFYGKVIDPWTGWFGLQGGIFARPFGYETPSVPTFHESPELSTVNQLIMPNEFELGEALVIESPAKFEKFYFRADANIVNGQGISVGSTNQTGTYQSRKDFIGRIKAGKVWSVGNTKLGINGSVSYYNGGVLQTTDKVWVVATNSTGQPTYINITDSTGILKSTHKREYYGAHLELKADYKIGTTTLRAEFIAGQQPGTNKSSAIPLGQYNAPPSADLYLRKFNGAMFYVTQSFKQKVNTHTVMHDITLKYDWYDPQTKVAGKDINPSNGFALADVKYSTIGFGYSFVPYNFFKLMIWYDYVVNEESGIPGYTVNFKKDNVLTIRTQFYVDSWWFVAKKKYTDNLMAKKY